MPDFNGELMKAWELHKETQAKLLEAKADGKAVGELETKLAALDTKIDEISSLQSKMTLIETAVKRMSLNGLAFDQDGETKSKDQLEHKAAFQNFIRHGEEDGLNDLQKKALSVNDDTSGGFMVHADLSGRIIKRIFETSPIRQFANVQMISTDALEGPLDTDQAEAYMVSETGTRAATGNPKLGMWRIPTHEMFTQPATTQKLLDDAAWDAEQWLSDKVADRFARKENQLFVTGTGDGEPRGFLSVPTVVEDASLDYSKLKKVGYIATGTADDFAPVPTSGSNPAQADSLIDLIFSLKTQYRESPGTALAMHRTLFARVRKLRDNLGNYLWQPGLGGTPSTLLGYPIAEFNDMPQLGAANKFCIAFANWREAYQIVDRIGIRVLRDPYTSKPFVLFYTTKRVGGDLLNCEAIKLLKFATT